MSRQRGRFRKTLWAAIVSGLLALDMLGNAVLGGSVDETISSRAGRLARQGSYVAKGLCVMLNRVDPGHCDRAADDKGG